jgi:hypothetical protein
MNSSGKQLSLCRVRSASPFARPGAKHCRLRCTAFFCCGYNSTQSPSRFAAVVPPKPLPVFNRLLPDMRLIFNGLRLG